jgi:hypothetical protein
MSLRNDMEELLFEWEIKRKTIGKIFLVLGIYSFHRFLCRIDI